MSGQSQDGKVRGSQVEGGSEISSGILLTVAFVAKLRVSTVEWGVKGGRMPNPPITEL